jgi:hypothetical protein
VAINACSFFNNGAGSDGGGVVLLSGSLSLAGCVFDGSSASMSGGAIFADYSSLDIDECTIHGSDAPTGAGLYCTFTSPTIDNTIIAFSTMGEAVYCDMTSTPTVACSNIYGNAGGDWVGCIVGLDGTAGNIAVDPRFCDAAGGDFTLRSDSQCLYSSCGRIGAFGRGCFGDNPVIGGITDVGNDQGREVRLLWERSGFDAPGDTVDITGYEIYQRQDEFLALDHGKEPIRLEAQTGTGAPLYEGWDYIGTAPAHGESLYQYRCPTLCDSTAQDSICWSVYFVRAVTPDPFTYYDSYPDSGYSVDNLAPSPPPGLNMTSATELAWEEVPDEDFDYYSVYGSSVAELDETATLIGYTIDTAKDITGHVYDYYQVTATDFSGNEGEESSVGNTYAGVHDLPDMSDTPAKFALRQNRPNPFSSITVIAFDLPEETGARITVYDTHGRIIKRLTNKNYEAGRHSVAWLGDDERGSRVGSGVYFVRMQAGDFDDMKKVMLLR